MLDVALLAIMVFEMVHHQSCKYVLQQGSRGCGYTDGIFVLLVLQNILFGAELDDEYENDSIDYDGGGARSLKGSLELVTMADLAVGSPDVDHAMDAATDDESDLNYFDDDLSE